MHIMMQIFDTFPSSNFIERVSENVSKPRTVYTVQIHGAGFVIFIVIDVYAYFRSIPPKTTNAVGFYLLLSSLFLY